MRITGYLFPVANTKLIWITSSFLLLGGGVRMYQAIIMSILADTVGSRYRYVLQKLPPPQR